MNDEEVKNSVKNSLNITEEYSINEIIEAMLMNDSVKLDEMRARNLLLRSAYTAFAKEIDSRDENRKRIAIANFRRPVR